MRTLPSEVDPDQGEQEAIALAEELAADLLLIDEWDARLEAERRHLHVIGTLRVLADGAGRGLTDLEEGCVATSVGPC
jgi:predicted nucleic acid-binding protein